MIDEVGLYGVVSEVLMIAQGIVVFRASPAYKIMCRKRYEVFLRYRKIQKGLFATEKQGYMPTRMNISKGIPFAT